MDAKKDYTERKTKANINTIAVILNLGIFNNAKALHAIQIRWLTSTVQVHQIHHMKSNYALEKIICNSRVTRRGSKRVAIVYQLL